MCGRAVVDAVDVALEEEGDVGKVGVVADDVGEVGVGFAADVGEGVLLGGWEGVVVGG